MFAYNIKRVIIEGEDHVIRDRGNIKWQGMFLPEHVKGLREMDWDMKKKQKPILDEQQLEIMQETIGEAMAETQELSFVYFKDDDFHLLIGRVHYVDPWRRELRIIDAFDRLTILKMMDVIHIARI